MCQVWQRLSLCFVCVCAQDNGHLYVCGDGANMASDVHKALQQIVQTHAKVDAAGAEQFLEQLMKAKRYQRDVWVT